MLRDFLPRLSNLDYGFLFEFSDKNTNRSLFYSDLFVPFRQNSQNVFFTQSHFGYNSFYNTGSYEGSNASYRVDLNVGGGYRFFLPGTTIRALGVNSFFDSSQIFGQWYNSWGVGLELVWQGDNNNLFDLSFNNYGNQFQDLEGAVGLWRKGDVNFDLELGFSRGFYNGDIDVRFKGNAYQFSTGENQTIAGGRGGIEIIDGGGLLKFAYDVGYDESKGTYHSISASMNIGFHIEDLFSSNNPFSMPQRIFMSPERNPARVMSQRVRRNNNLPDKVVTAQRRPSSGAYFRIDFNGPYISGSGSYTQSTTNTTGTWNITYAKSGTTLNAGASSYTISLAGDTSKLTFPLTVTITPNPTQPTGTFTVAQSGTAGAAETITFNSASDVKTVPPSGNTIGTAAVPSISKTYGSGTSGSQGTISIAGTGVQTLSVTVNSVNEPTPGVAYFNVAINAPYSYGSGTYTQSSNTAGTWNITPVKDGTNYRTRSASYTVTLSGDTSLLTFPLTATITPNATVATGAFTVAQSGTSGVAETVTFNNSSDLVKTVPTSGGSVGTSAVPNVTRQIGSGSSGSQGSITISATGIQALSIDVVSSNEPSPLNPYFELTINTPYWTAEAPGSTGTYIQNSNTSGTWTITYGPNGGNPATGYLCAAYSYTIKLMGDTSSLPATFTITITPSPTPTGDVELRVNESQSSTWSTPQTVTMTTATGSVTVGKTSGLCCASGIGPQPCVIRCVPEVYANPGTITTNTGGNFTISAPGVQSLVVTLSSTN